MRVLCSNASFTAYGITSKTLCLLGGSWLTLMLLIPFTNLFPAPPPLLLLQHTRTHTLSRSLVPSLPLSHSLFFSLSRTMPTVQEQSESTELPARHPCVRTHICTRTCTCACNHTHPLSLSFIHTHTLCVCDVTTKDMIQQYLTTHTCFLVTLATYVCDLVHNISHMCI